MSARVLACAVQDSINVTTGSAGPARNRSRRKPSRFAPVVHVAEFVAGACVALAYLIR